MKNRHFIALVLIVMSGLSSWAQAPLYDTIPIYDTTRVYDIVTDADSCYLFSSPKPCFSPTSYYPVPGAILLQEYVIPDTVTVYGVALTFTNYVGDPICAGFAGVKAHLMTPLGPSWGSYYSMQIVDSVTLNRSHPRFCWFQYMDDCDKDSLVVPCYELYFDTPAQINRVTDTFYVGMEKDPSSYRFSPKYYGGRYDNSLPGHLWIAPGSTNPYGGSNDMFLPLNSNYDNFNKLWGIAFPIIGFRCKPVPDYWLESYIVGSYTLVWNNMEDSTVYNVRLVGEDGSDTTFVTTDTTFVIPPLSDSVRYTVMLRKQCHYATTNYDTTVSSEWLSSITIGTTILPTVWRTVTTGVNDSTMGMVLGGGEYADSSTVTLTASAYGGYEFYEWSDGDVSNPRQVFVTSDTSFTALFRELEDTVGILQPAGEGFLLQPNPARGTVRIVLPSSAQGGRLSLCDLAGRELEVRTAAGTTVEWDVSTLPAGAYLVKLTTPQGTVARRLLVE